MKSQLRSLAFAAGIALALLATLATVAMAGSRARLASTAAAIAVPSNSLAAPAAATSTCKKMEAQKDVYWVTLADDGSISETVDYYPTGVLTVAAAFDYTCVPNKTTLTTIWSIDGETVLTSKDTPKANNKSDTWSAWIFKNDGSSLDDGLYGIEFYVGQNLLTSGQITVGGEITSSTEITSSIVTTDTLTDVDVQGTIVNSKTKKPISGAMVIVLNTDVDIQTWLKSGADTDVFASGQTDSKGQFALDNRVEVGVAHPWIIGAKGYKPVAQQDYQITADEATDPFVLNIALDPAK